MSTITFRADKDLLKEIDELVKLNKTDRATEIRRILSENILKAKLDSAIRLYQQGATLDEAATKANVSLWDLIEYMPTIGQTIIVDAKELELELKKSLNIG